MKDATKDFNVNLVDFGGNTALHLASANGFIDVVKYLVNELHVDINPKNKSLSTPLSWAAFNGQKKVVEFLLEKGADFNSKNINGKKPSELAYDSGFYDVSDILLTKENELLKGSIKEEKNEGDDIDLEEEDEKECKDNNKKQEESQGYILNSAQNDINIKNNNAINPVKDEAISPKEKKAQSPFSKNLNSSQKSSSKKRNSYHKKSGQNAWKNLAFRFPIQKSLGKVEIPFAFQQNFKDSNDDSRFHSYITLKGIPRLFIDVSDDDKKDKFKLASEIDSLKNTNNEKENYI